MKNLDRDEFGASLSRGIRTIFFIATKSYLAYYDRHLVYS